MTIKMNAVRIMHMHLSTIQNLFCCLPIHCIEGSSKCNLRNKTQLPCEFRCQWNFFMLLVYPLPTTHYPLPTHNTTNRIVDRTSCERIMNTRDLILTRYVECRGPQAIVLFGARSKEQAQFTQERPKEKVH